MKSTVLRTFKQIYKDKNTQEIKEYIFQVTIVRDTQDYNYRILNVTSGTIWRNNSFETFKQASEFLDNVPNFREIDKKEVKLKTLY